MARRPRIHFDGIPLHIVQRGHNRSPCFFAEADHSRYLAWLGEALEEAQCTLHAYVLMTNHVHLLLTPAMADTVPKLLISLGRRYVQYVNRAYTRTGTLWDSRYKSSVVQDETYFLVCQRYIELNPVRAGIVEHPAQYRWTSYRANALGCRDPRVKPHPAHPNTLARALLAMANRGATRMAPWAGHLCIGDSGGKTGGAALLGSWGRDIAFPAIRKRYEALEKLGADRLPDDEQKQGWFGGRVLSLPLQLLMAVLLGIAGVLMCVVVPMLVWVSVMLTALFTILRAGLLHAILR